MPKVSDSSLYAGSSWKVMLVNGSDATKPKKTFNGFVVTGIEVVMVPFAVSRTT
jgi:hypothetical protein